MFKLRNRLNARSGLYTVVSLEVPIPPSLSVVLARVLLSAMFSSVFFSQRWLVLFYTGPSLCQTKMAGFCSSVVARVNRTQIQPPSGNLPQSYAVPCRQSGAPLPPSPRLLMESRAVWVVRIICFRLEIVMSNNCLLGFRRIAYRTLGRGSPTDCARALWWPCHERSDGWDWSQSV